jgi:hypothetical protein
MKTRFGDPPDVLVDACQFRISPQTLAEYLACGLLVAVTGSKFVGGPGGGRGGGGGAWEGPAGTHDRGCRPPLAAGRSTTKEVLEDKPGNDDS